MRSIGLCLARTDGRFAEGLAALNILVLLLLANTCANAATISTAFQAIKESRPGVGLLAPLPSQNLINSTASTIPGQYEPGDDFVDFGLGGPTLPVHHTVDPDNSWAVRVSDQSNTLPVPVLYLDLGFSRYSNGVIVWNSNQGDTSGATEFDAGTGGSGLKKANLYYYDTTDNGWDFDSSVAGVASWTLIDQFDFNQDNNPTSSAQAKSFTAIKARAFKLELLEGFGVESWVTSTIDENTEIATFEQQQLIWLAELAFYATDAPPSPPPLDPVPEPSSLLVFAALSGVGVIGKRYRRKRC